MLNLSDHVLHPPWHAMPSDVGIDAELSDAGTQPLLFDDLEPRIKNEVLDHLCDDTTPCEWSEEAIVIVHWRLLMELDKLDDPETPLADKIDTLRWVFTSPQKDEVGFSFASCVRVVGNSPLSPTPFIGKVDIEEVRQMLCRRVGEWFRRTIAKYPQWVQDVILDNPDWIDQMLETDPQWLNKQVKKVSTSETIELFSPEQGAQT